MDEIAGHGGERYGDVADCGVNGRGPYFARSTLNARCAIRLGVLDCELCGLKSLCAGVLESRSRTGLRLEQKFRSNVSGILLRERVSRNLISIRASGALLLSRTRTQFGLPRERGAAPGLCKHITITNISILAITYTPQKKKAYKQ
jgi:hypothetical protein